MTIQGIRDKAVTLSYSSSINDSIESKALLLLSAEIDSVRLELPDASENEVIIIAAKRRARIAEATLKMYSGLSGQGVSMTTALYRAEIRVMEEFIPATIPFETLFRYCTQYTGDMEWVNFLAWAKRQPWFLSTDEDTLSKIHGSLTLN